MVYALGIVLLELSLGENIKSLGKENLLGLLCERNHQQTYFPKSNQVIAE
jgi:hypothetical protein